MPTKINTIRSHAKRGMRYNASTSNRPEEKLCANLINYHLTAPHSISMQRKVNFTQINYCIADILLIVEILKKFVIRLNGPPHDERKAVNHDRLQKLYLEDLGYIVIDFWYHDMPFLFSRNDHVLSQDELKEAWYEVSKKLKEYNLFLKPLDQSIDLQN